MGSLGPELSAVVVISGDTVEWPCGSADLAENLAALTSQQNPPSMEIIVPYHARVMGIDELKARLPQVQFLRIDDLKSLAQGGGREHHDELRARGVAAARGEIVACLEDHVRPALDWSARIVEAHRQPYACIGGAIENGADRPINWAAYFCDLGRYQNPVPDGESPFASVVNASYKRQALESVRPVWQGRFNETSVHRALVGKGMKLALSSGIVVRQFRTGMRLSIALREFFIWGRSYARTRGRLVGRRRRTLLAILAPLIPGRLILRLTANVIVKRRTIAAFVRAFPLTALLLASWSCGEFAGYVAGDVGIPSR